MPEPNRVIDIEQFRRREGDEPPAPGHPDSDGEAVVDDVPSRWRRPSKAPRGRRVRRGDNGQLIFHL